MVNKLLYEETKLNLKRQGYKKGDIFKILSNDFNLLILEIAMKMSSELWKLKKGKYIFKESKYSTVPEILNKKGIVFSDEKDIPFLIGEQVKVYGRVKGAKKKKRIKEIETELKKNTDYIKEICLK